MSNKGNQVMTLVDTGHTIKIMSHNLNEPFEENEFIFLRKVLSYVGVASMRTTAPVSIMTIVDDGTSIKFLCYHADGTTSLGLSCATLDFLEEAILLAKNFEKKKEGTSKPMQGWERD